MRGNVLWCGSCDHSANTVCFDAVANETGQRLTGNTLTPKSSQVGIFALNLELPARMNNAEEPNETGIRFQLDGEHSLAVNSTNTEAINLYKKFRFVEYGIEPNALKIEDRYFAEMLMDRLSVS